MLDFDEISIIISEVDGIITDGFSDLGEAAITISKRFCLADFDAINEIKRVKKFAFLTQDPFISLSLCRKKNIPFFFSEGNKSRMYFNILNRYELKPENVLYIGASLIDKESMCKSAISMCSISAPKVIQRIADHVIPIESGKGVLSYVSGLLSGNIRCSTGGE